MPPCPCDHFTNGWKPIHIENVLNVIYLPKVQGPQILESSYTGRHVENEIMPRFLLTCQNIHGTNSPFICDILTHI